MCAKTFSWIYCVNPHKKRGENLEGRNTKQQRQSRKACFFKCVFNEIILPLHHFDLPLNIFAISAHNKPTSRTNTNMNLERVVLIVSFVCVILLNLHHPPTPLPIHIANISTYVQRYWKIPLNLKTQHFQARFHKTNNIRKNTHE